MLKRYTLRHLFILLGVIAALVIVMFSAIVLRDYNIVTRGGLHLESKVPVLAAPAFSLDNAIEGKLTVRMTNNGAVAYDVQVSRFENMLVSRTYRTALPQKAIGLMRSEKTYYVRVRSVVNKQGTSRKINGNWSATRPVKIK